jgi:hypothetical protein
VFARCRSRIQQATVEIGDVSSGFLQFVAMAFHGDQRSQLVHRHRDSLLAYAAPNSDPVHGRLHLPSARHLVSQHSLTWDEWSSPGELIHPGDAPSISSITSSAAKTCLQVGYSQRHSHGWPRPGSYLWRRSRSANREEVSRSSGCRKGLRGVSIRAKSPNTLGDSENSLVPGKDFSVIRGSSTVLAGSPRPRHDRESADPFSPAPHPGELHSRMKTTHPVRTDSGR